MTFYTTTEFLNINLEFHDLLDIEQIGDTKYLILTPNKSYIYDTNTNNIILDICITFNHNSSLSKYDIIKLHDGNKMHTLTYKPNMGFDNGSLFPLDFYYVKDNTILFEHCDQLNGITMITIKKYKYSKNEQIKEIKSEKLSCSMKTRIHAVEYNNKKYLVFSDKPDNSNLKMSNTYIIDEDLNKKQLDYAHIISNNNDSINNNKPHFYNNRLVIMENDSNYAVIDITTGEIVLKTPKIYNNRGERICQNKLQFCNDNLIEYNKTSKKIIIIKLLELELLNGNNNGVDGVDDVDNNNNNSVQLNNRLHNKDCLLCKQNNECNICKCFITKKKVLYPCGHSKFCENCIEDMSIMNKCTNCNSTIKIIVSIND